MIFRDLFLTDAPLRRLTFAVVLTEMLMRLVAALFAWCKPGASAPWEAPVATLWAADVSADAGVAASGPRTRLVPKPSTRIRFQKWWFNGGLGAEEGMEKLVMTEKGPHG